MNCALNFYSAFVLGLFSSLHCVGMCGGIVALFAGSMGAAQKSLLQKSLLHLCFSLGRVFTYGALGLLSGVLSYFLLNRFMPALAPGLRAFSGVLLVLFGMHLSGYFFPLNALERAGKPVWQFMSPKLKGFLPVNSMFKSFSAGMVWGLLPCGMVYSTLLIAMTAASSLDATSIMLGFGLGTVPTLVMSGLMIQKLQAFLRTTALKFTVSISVILYGVWIIISSAMDMGLVHQH